MASLGKMNENTARAVLRAGCNCGVCCVLLARRLKLVCSLCKTATCPHAVAGEDDTEASASSRGVEQPLPPLEYKEPEEEVFPHSEEGLVLCDGCDVAFHLSCVLHMLGSESPEPGEAAGEWWFANHVSSVIKSRCIATQLNCHFLGFGFWLSRRSAPAGAGRVDVHVFELQHHNMEKTNVRILSELYHAKKARNRGMDALILIICVCVCGGSC